MLEFYFKSPWRLEQIRGGPRAEHIGNLAAKLYRRGFTRATGQRILSLTGTDVTDAGLERLKGLSKLQRLKLQGTAVTEEGVKKLQESLPECKITF